MEGSIKEKFEKATDGNLNIIEQVDQEINGKKVPALKLEKTIVKFYGREILEEQLRKEELCLCELRQSSPFMYVCEIGSA